VILRYEVRRCAERNEGGGEKRKEKRIQKRGE
jgi:hypothetical protein